MENLKNIYEQEIKLLQLFQDTIFYGVDFDKINYEVDNTKSFMQKKKIEKLKSNVEITCEEKIYKKWLEKYLKIKIIKSKKDYEIFKIIIDKERIKLIHEIKELNKIKVISKQFGLNGYIVYKYCDGTNNYLLHQNVNNLLNYLEEYNEDLYCNVFSFEKEEFKHISKLPYNIVYESIKNHNVLNSEEIIKLYEFENKKRIAINSSEINVKKENKKNIEKIISKMKMVYESSKDIYNIVIDKLLSISEFDEIIQKGAKIVKEINLEENEDFIYESNLSELEYLKNKKSELLEIKIKTDEIINKLQNILLN